MTGILIVALAGLVGTTVMIGTMALIHKLKLANADMVRAIGSMYTRSYELAFGPGLVIHYSAGLVFSFVYAVVVAAAPIHSPRTAIVLCTIMGLVHGLIVGLLLEVEVAEHHPVKQFREAGFGVVVSHVIGHIAYGFSMGMVMLMTWPIFSEHLDDFTQIGSSSDLLGFAMIWLPIFGMPLLFIGYVSYAVLTTEIRSEAHRLDEEHHKQDDKKSDSGKAA